MDTPKSGIGVTGVGLAGGAVGDFLTAFEKAIGPAAKSSRLLGRGAHAVVAEGRWIDLYVVVNRPFIDVS